MSLDKSLHQLPQQQTQSGSESLLLCAAVVLVVAVGAVWLVVVKNPLEECASVTQLPLQQNSKVVRTIIPSRNSPFVFSPRYSFGTFI